MNRVQASLPDTNQARPYYRAFSRGFDANAPTGLEPGDYAFELTQAGETKSLGVTVTAGMSNGDVLSAVAEAINAATLPVQAEIVRGGKAELAAQGCLAAGSVLALGVNGAFADTDVALKDTSGHLVGALALTAVANPTEPASLAVYDVQGSRTYQPTTYSSKGFDPNATTSLAAGTYTFDWSLGESSGSLSLLVQATDTWGDVLNNLAFATSGGEGLLAAEVTDQRRPSNILTDDTLYLMMDGKALSISAASPKVGERLMLTGADAASTQALATLGLSATARPGSDGRMTIDGRQEVRAPGVFSEDQGRLVLTQTDSFAETLPVAVVEAVDRLASGLADVVGAYNGLRDLILRNEPILRQGAADLWRDPFADKAADYGRIGLAEWGADRLLAFDHDAFFTALGAEPDTVESLLLDPDSGLFSVWTATTQKAQEDGGESFLLPAAALPDPLAIDPSPRTEFEIEKKNQLLDLYDGASPDTGLDWPWEPGPIVSKKG